MLNWKKYNIHRHTVAKWKNQEEMTDKSHRPERMHTALNDAQEAIVVELRRVLSVHKNSLTT